MWEEGDCGKGERGKRTMTKASMHASESCSHYLKFMSLAIMWLATW